MQTNQVLTILNRSFDIGEYYGTIPEKEIYILLYLMFIDEYYEVKRDITINSQSDVCGLNDDFVKLLNLKIDEIIECSDIINSNDLDYLQNILYWVIPNYPPIDGDNKDYVQDNVLFIQSSVVNNILSAYGNVNNYILQL